MITVAEIREKYPTPCRLVDRPTCGKGYCVGGAFVLSITTDDIRFPSYLLLARALRKTNTALSDDTSLAFAARITYANDHGRFDEAWDLLGRALQTKGG